MTYRQKRAQIRKNKEEAKTTAEKVFWNDILEMSAMRSMKSWTIAQLTARWHQTNAQHNISYEFITVK